jgi:uncharacterized protein YkwD
MKFGILLFVLPFLFNKEERTFKRLNKAFEKNTEKAFELSKKINSRDKSLASPYYFQFLVYEKRATLSKSIKSQSTILMSALSSGMAFEKRAGENLLVKTEWAIKKENFKSKVVECLNKLNDEKNKTQFKKLKEKALKVYDEISVDLSENVDQKEIDEKKVINLTPNKEYSKDYIVNHKFPLQPSSPTKVNYSKNPTGKENFISLNEEEEKKFIEILNKARIAKNLIPLEIDPDLTRAARYHAYDMANENYFSHETQNILHGKLTESIGTFERIQQFYPKGANTENIYMGYGMAEEAYESWYNSKGHYENMFNSVTSKVGIGIAKSSDSDFGYYWVFCSSFD